MLTRSSSSLNSRPSNCGISAHSKVSFGVDLVRQAVLVGGGAVVGDDGVEPTALVRPEPLDAANELVDDDGAARVPWASSPWAPPWLRGRGALGSWRR